MTDLDEIRRQAVLAPMSDQLHTLADRIALQITYRTAMITLLELGIAADSPRLPALLRQFEGSHRAEDIT